MSNEKMTVREKLVLARPYLIMLTVAVAGGFVVYYVRKDGTASLIETVAENIAEVQVAIQDGRGLAGKPVLINDVLYATQRAGVSSTGGHEAALSKALKAGLETYRNNRIGRPVSDLV